MIDAARIKNGRRVRLFFIIPLSYPTGWVFQCEKNGSILSVGYIKNEARMYLQSKTDTMTRRDLADNIYQLSWTDNAKVEHTVTITCQYRPDSKGRDIFILSQKKERRVKGLLDKERVETARFRKREERYAGGAENAVFKIERVERPAEGRVALLQDEYVALYGMNYNVVHKKYTRMQQASAWPCMFMATPSKDFPVIVELCGGEALRAVAGRLSTSAHPDILHFNYNFLLKMMMYVTAALHRLHKRGYVHGDVKADNCVIRHTEVLELAHEQFAALLSLPFVITMLIYEYAAPEEKFVLRLIDPGCMTTCYEKGVLIRKEEYMAPESKKACSPDSPYAIYGYSADIFSVGHMLAVLMGGVGIPRISGLMFALQATHHNFLKKMASECLQAKAERRPTALMLHRACVLEYRWVQVEYALMDFLMLWRVHAAQETYVAWVDKLLQKVHERKYDMDTVGAQVFFVTESHVKPLLQQSNSEALEHRYNKLHAVYYEVKLHDALMFLIEDVRARCEDLWPAFAISLGEIQTHLLQYQGDAAYWSLVFIALIKAKLQELNDLQPKGAPPLVDLAQFFQGASSLSFLLAEFHKIFQNYKDSALVMPFDSRSSISPK